MTTPEILQKIRDACPELVNNFSTPESSGYGGETYDGCKMISQSPIHLEQLLKVIATKLGKGCRLKLYITDSGELVFDLLDKSIPYNLNLSVSENIEQNNELGSLIKEVLSL